MKIIQKEDNKDFFIPNAEDRMQAKRVYEAIEEYIRCTHHIHVRDFKVQKVLYQKNGYVYADEVGKESNMNGEIVVAIFIGADGKCYVCTPNNGVIRNRPLECDAIECELFTLRW